jgi:hypothetical protein
MIASPVFSNPRQPSTDITGDRNTSPAQSKINQASTNITATEDLNSNDATIINPKLSGGTTPSGHTLNKLNPPNVRIPRIKEEVFSLGLSSYFKDISEELQTTLQIMGREFDMWQLYSACFAQNSESNMPLDFGLVAKVLGIKEYAQDLVRERVQTWYEENLEPFLEVMEGFDAESDDHSNDESSEMDDALATVPQSPAAAYIRPSTGFKQPVDNSEQELPSSLLVSTRPGKRKASTLPSSSPFRKHPRLSRDREIPSTPDENTSNLNHPTVMNPSNTSPSLAVTSNQRSVVEDSQSQPDIDSQASRFNITPSQQLRSEMHQISPIPMLLERLPTVVEVASETTQPSFGNNTPNRGGQEHGMKGSRDEQLEIETNKKASGTILSPHSVSTPKQLNRSGEVAGLSPDIRKDGSVPEPTTEPAPQADQTSDDDNFAEIDAAIERFESMGYRRDDVITAFKATTMCPGEAGVVMESLRQKKGIPDHHEGIWTKRDDEALQFIDSVDMRQKPQTLAEKYALRNAKKEFNRLVKKHTLERIETRREFLEAFERVELR